MEIILNGKPKDIISSLTIEGLLEELKVNSKSVVVELNLDILDKNKYSSTYLKENDKVEIVHFVGGG
jgi:sulfur carrier protein